jgi:hemoglobin-like flavoprotein
MTQIELVQKTFAVVAPIADDVAVLFYRRLFEIDPLLESMFTGNMLDQRRKLVVMLTAAVKGLPRLDRLIPVLQDLGRRHADYGVADSHYETVRHCCGRSKKASDRRSRRKSKTPGRRCMACLPRR